LYRNNKDFEKKSNKYEILREYQYGEMIYSCIYEDGLGVVLVICN